MKNLAVMATLVLTIGLVSCQPSGGGKNIKVSTEEEKTFYSVGAMFGSRLENLELTDKEIDLIAQGIRDSAKGGKLQVDLAAYQPKVRDLFKNRMAKAAEKLKSKGNEFIENFVKKEGAKKTESGLAYKILKEGKGEAPGAEDTVEVHYHGTLIDGTVFDSSVERGKKVSFPLNKVIKGWTEGLQLVKPGGKIKLVIPSELAYGEHGAPPKIPGGATLVFEVELFSVKKAGKK